MTFPRIRLWHGLLLVPVVAIAVLGLKRQSFAGKPCAVGPGARCFAADLSALELRRADLRGADLRRARL
ncbi:MAG: pentapeptide repeat-containing protein, partial [Cyanobacteriota bacterium]